MRDVIRWSTNHAALVNLIFSGVVMTATVVYAILTASLVKETKRMRRAQTDPEVAAYLEPDYHSIGLLHLVIRNVGSGPAHDVRFELSNVNLADWAAEAIQRLRIWEHGIRYLAPGSSIRTVAGAAFQEGAQDFTLTVRVLYADAENHQRDATYILDFISHTGVTQVANPRDKDLLKHLEGIRKSIEALRDDSPPGRSHHSDANEPPR
jgi:hypothetical protein